MIRICPSCKNNLGAHENYFCLSCGHKLEDNLIQHTPTFVSTVRKFEVGQNGPILDLKRLNLHVGKKIQVVMALVVGMGLFSLGVIFLTSKLSEVKKQKIVSEATPVVEKPVYNNTENLNLDQLNFAFGSEKITDFVPVNVQLVVEGNDFDSMFELFYGNKREDTVFPDFEYKLDGSFVLFARQTQDTWEYAIVSNTSSDLTDAFVEDDLEEEVEALETEDETEDIESVESKAEEESEEVEEDNTEIMEESTVPAENPYLYAVVSDALVITSSQKLMDEIKEAAKGQTKTVKHNPKYSSFSAYLPDSGQLRFMNFTEDFNIVKKLFESFSPSEGIVKILEPVISAQYNKFVIRKDE